MKSRAVIGFKPEQKFEQEFSRLVEDLGVKRGELAEQAVLRGLEAAVQDIAHKKLCAAKRLEKKTLARRVVEMVRGVGIEPTAPTVSRLGELFPAFA